MTHPENQTESPRSPWPVQQSLASGLLLCIGLLAVWTARLPLLVFHLDGHRIPWTSASDGLYGTWVLWTAAVLSASAALASWRRRNLSYLPLVTALLVTLSSTQILLSGLEHVPKVGSGRVLLLEETGPWTEFAQSTHLQVSPGSGLFAAGAVILGLCIAAWLLHRGRDMPSQRRLTENR